MKFRNMMLKYYAPAKEDGGDPHSGSGDDPAVDPTADPSGDLPETVSMSRAELDDLINSRVTKEISGLKNKNSELIGMQKSLREKLSAYDGVDPEKARTILDQLAKDEEMQLLASGKHEEVFNRRTEKLRSTLQAKYEAAHTKATELEAEVESSRKQIKNLMIDQQVKDMFIKEGGVETAMQDVVYRARNLFDLEEGVPVARDSKGELIRGDEGPITINEWIKQLRKEAPHLYPQSRSGGLNGGSGGDQSVTELEAAAGDPARYIELRRKQREGKRN